MGPQSLNSESPNPEPEKVMMLLPGARPTYLRQPAIRILCVAYRV